jgi:hypothetical protein
LLDEPLNPSGLRPDLAPQGAGEPDDDLDDAVLPH